MALRAMWGQAFWLAAGLLPGAELALPPVAYSKERYKRFLLGSHINPAFPNIGKNGRRHRHVEVAAGDRGAHV